jgi:unsaturated rhamnogalacturonyl hydrolase
MADIVNSFERKLNPGTKPWSIRGVETLLQRHPSLSHRWHYEPGVALLAVQSVWEWTRDNRYFEYIQRNIDEFVDEEGNIRTYTLAEYNLDQINQGKVLFSLYAETGAERYKKAAFLLREQLRTHPRTGQKGFWHKKIYPEQMWLDGLYMAGPFYTQFARVFDEPDIFDDVAHQVATFDRRARDVETGLLYHAWDYARSQKWADPQMGCSPNFWARAMAWFMMALPDILDHFPEEHPKRDLIVQVFRDTVEATLAVQDEASGVWYQILDQGGRTGNYLESSASCMFVYALAKGVRLGYLDSSCLRSAVRGYQGVLEQFIEVDDRGWVNLHGICSVGGLGGDPYRDGTFEYYISEPVVSNDYKGFGPFIMASVEIERAGENNGADDGNWI